MKLIYAEEFKAKSNVCKTSDVRSTVLLPGTWKIKIF